MGNGNIRRASAVLATILILVQLGNHRAWGRLTTPYQAEQVVKGWLKADARPLNTAITPDVLNVESVTNEAGEPVYYIVYLHPAGFVIVSADDLVEPIIAFSADGTCDPSLETPLGALASRDMSGRAAIARADDNPGGQIGVLSISDAQHRWYEFISLAQVSSGGITTQSLASISDVRVAPLVQSKWAQDEVCGNSCYNYYTPEGYYSGCVATAMAQLMRYHMYPDTGIGVQDFIVEVEGDPWTAYTRGGNGYGSQYSWSEMVLVPDCSTTTSQRQAIGALCFDAGISVNTDYRPGASSADVLLTKEALTGTFKYSNAINGYNDSEDIGPGLIAMINPNLDAGGPVIVGIWGQQSGHAVLCDGYGYSGSTLYHHLNMGWGGTGDVWYNLPNVDAHTKYTSVIACTYNVFVSGTGEIISGQVIDVYGLPVRGAKVTAKRTGSFAEATTNANGIYALTGIRSGSTYEVSVTKAGHFFSDQTVRTGTSRDLSPTPGNEWQIDFVGTVAGDCNADRNIDAADFAVFASAWQSEPGDPGWNPACDISTPADGLIDGRDLDAFLQVWLGKGR
ncbi:MAG: C10 family peptidase [Phycisphaerales bacterium]|nr:MAG: C10 family peptidase [Phycisphaerales bacterium]